MPLNPNVDVLNVSQRSPEWFAARVGRVTSSKCDAIFTKGRKKGEESVQRRHYRLELVCGQITGRPAEDMDAYKGPWVERGKALEAEARATYEARYACMVWTPGFLAHRTLKVGSSLDGVVGNFERVLEFKVPKPATHLRWIRAGQVLPEEYESQVLMHFDVSGAPVTDFVSYCPDMPSAIQLHVVTVQRPSMDLFVAGVAEFLQEVEKERLDVMKLIDAAIAKAA